VTTIETTGAGETFLRARRPAQKQQRREDILAAARELALADGVRGVSLAGIAARAGIDKSALLRYFETREQIFLELTAREWPSWVRALHDGLDGAAPGSAGAADLVAGVVARSFADRPLFCDLLAHTPLNLERNVSPEAVRGYKMISLAAVGEAADVVHRVLPDLTEQECREFISAVASLAGNLWQIANPVPALAALFASDPALAHACVDLVPRLRRTAEILLAGLIPSRLSGPDALAGPSRAEQGAGAHGRCSRGDGWGSWGVRGGCRRGGLGGSRDRVSLGTAFPSRRRQRVTLGVPPDPKCPR
jgi:AcrR family transcriptional regulator